MNEEINSLKEDIPFEKARAAHQWTSFDPEKRAEMRREDYAQTVNAMRERFESETLNDVQCSLLEDELKRFRNNYRTAYLRLLDAESRCASTMITGGSNFNVRRNEKHNRWAHNRRTEVIELEKKVAKSIRRKLEAAKTPLQVMDEETARLRYHVEHCIEVLGDIEKGAPYAPSLFKSSLAGKLERSAKNGHAEPVKQALEYLRKLQSEQLAKPAFTERHGIWKLGCVAEDIVEEQSNAPTGEEVVESLDGVEVVRNFDAERIQLRFPGKPPDNVRNLLKRNGFRWSPTWSSWQRALNNTGEYKAKTVANMIANGKNS